MNAVLKERDDAGDRSRLVREKEKLRTQGEKACAPLAAKSYQAQHDLTLARETLAKAEQALAAAQANWSNYSRSIERGINALDTELLATAPRAIDAALADVEVLKNRFRGHIAQLVVVRMSDGSQEATPESIAEHEHSQRRWQAFVSAEKELQAMKLEALGSADLARRLDDIRTRVKAVLFPEQATA